MLNGKDDAHRESKRKNLFFNFEVYDINGDHVGSIGDLTLNGLRIIGKNPIEQKTVQQLIIKLPERISEKQEIKFEAECMWSKKVDEAYHIGFKTEHSDQENIKIIKIIMELLASPEILIL